MALSGSSSRRNLKDVRDTLESLRNMIKKLKKGQRRLRSEIELAVRQLDGSIHMRKEAGRQLCSAFKYYTNVKAIQPQGMNTNACPDENFLVKHHEETDARKNNDADSVENLSSSMESIDDSVESLDYSMEADDSSVDNSSVDNSSVTDFSVADSDSTVYDFGGPSKNSFPWYSSDSSEADDSEPSMNSCNSSDEDSEEPSTDVTDSSKDKPQELNTEFWTGCIGINKTIGDFVSTNYGSLIITNHGIKDIVSELKKKKGNLKSLESEESAGKFYKILECNESCSNERSFRAFGINSEDQTNFSGDRISEENRQMNEGADEKVLENSSLGRKKNVPLHSSDDNLNVS